VKCLAARRNRALAILAAAFILNCTPALAHDAIRVLFIGNSLTYYNNLPGMVRAVYKSTVPDALITTEMLASGGALIRDHLDRGHLKKVLATQHFDVVVLQELGGFPQCAVDFYGCADSPSALKEAVSLVRRAGARPILFGTWQASPTFQADLSRTTREMAKDLHADVADIGGAIYAVNGNGIPMLDGSGHPLQAASWLAAMVLVKTMTRHALPAVAPAQICEPDWTGKGPSEDSLASLQAQPPSKCFLLSETLFRKLLGVANLQADGDRIANACPGIAAWRAGRPEAKATTAAPRAIANQTLSASLLAMAKNDQIARRIWSLSTQDPSAVKRLQAIDAVHLKALRHIVAANGVPTSDAVGGDGLSVFWLLIQHADCDVPLQETILKAFERANTGIPLDKIALLTDRVRVNQGRPQVYGTQFQQIDGKFVPLAIEDPENLSARRETMGLMPMVDYQCGLRAIYSPKDQ
jgi:hypothetical protein